MSNPVQRERIRQDERHADGQRHRAAGPAAQRLAADEFADLADVVPVALLDGEVRQVALAEVFGAAGPSFG